MKTFSVMSIPIQRLTLAAYEEYWTTLKRRLRQTSNQAQVADINAQIVVLDDLMIELQSCLPKE